MAFSVDRVSRRGLSALIVVIGIVGATRPASPAGPAILRENDCLTSWRIAGAVECEDGDPACDVSDQPGCVFVGQLCFNDNDDSRLNGQCGGAVSRFVLRSGGVDRISRANQSAVINEVRALGGAAAGSSVAFPAPITTQTCTAPFKLQVPLRRRGRFETPGSRKLRSLTMGGGVDRDRLDLVCMPQDGVTPGLTTGCRIDLSRDHCKRRRGDFGRFGLSEHPFCLCRTDDSGRDCDADQPCQGLCIAPRLDSSEGNCSLHVTEFGCFALIGFVGSGTAFVCID